MLVVREIRADQELARQLFAPGAIQDPTHQSFGTPSTLASFDKTAGGTFRVSSGQILQSLDRLANDMGRAIVKSSEISVNYTDRQSAAVRAQTRDWILEVRSDLAEVLTGNVRSRQLGIGLLCAGIVLSGAGSVLSSI